VSAPQQPLTDDQTDAQPALPDRDPADADAVVEPVDTEDDLEDDDLEDDDDDEDEDDEPDSDPVFGESSVLPVCCEQLGQALMPCAALTRSATWICCSRLASSGWPEPPKARHVESVNCRPPPKPLPVLMPQSPPLSHWARASQSVSAWAAGAASRAAGTTGAPAATTASVARPRRPGRWGARWRPGRDGGRTERMSTGSPRGRALPAVRAVAVGERTGGVPGVGSCPGTAPAGRCPPDRTALGLRSAPPYGPTRRR
jgi:hypothetical protein